MILFTSERIYIKKKIQIQIETFYEAYLTRFKKIRLKKLLFIYKHFIHLFENHAPFNLHTHHASCRIIKTLQCTFYLI